MIKILFSYHDEFINEIDMINQILISDDFDYFHLCKPNFDYIQFKEFIREIDEDLHYKIVIHSYYSLVNEFDLAGVNLNKKALGQLAYADEVDKCFIQPLVLKNNLIEINREKPSSVSYSGDTLEEINGLPFKVEYAFLNPNFDKLSKDGFDSKSLKDRLEETNIKIIAKEGVTLLEYDHLQSEGFDGYARLNSFWNDFVIKNKD